MTTTSTNADNTQSPTSSSMVWLMGQMFIIPIRTFVYGMEMLVDTMRAFQSASARGLHVIAGGEPLDYRDPVNGPAAQRHAQQVDITPVNTTTTKNTAEATEPEALKEARYMDKDLRDDTLKLVRYKILFVKRDYEHAFPEQEALVWDNLDGTAFTAWKVAEFIQSLPIEAPKRWKNYPDGRDSNGKPLYRDGEKLTGFPEEDKKYLRVYYEVLERYPREKFRYEEEQVDVLKEIRDEIRMNRESERT